VEAASVALSDEVFSDAVLSEAELGAG